MLVPLCVLFSKYLKVFDIIIKIFSIRKKLRSNVSGLRLQFVRLINKWADLIILSATKNTKKRTV